ncbi:nucleosome assembly protein 1-like 1 isoform X2 [Artemia franciscana]|uniref:nucleosome assembly protein 1-like 1 isoform X2 n=1 Tax=Artemia franciscana TaxID=6661 RepID=UPI0032DA1725
MSRLNSKVGQSSDYVQMLPEVVKRRIRALKNLQHEAIVEQANFFNEVHELEVKCHQKNLPLYEQRQKIVNGVYEPLEAEMQEKLDKENENLSKELKAKAKIAESEKNEEIFPEDVKGIPKFWLTVLKNVNIFKNIIQEHDEPILRHLTDITVDLTSCPMGFTLKFHFSPNEYFTDSVLTKIYHMNYSVNSMKFHFCPNEYFMDSILTKIYHMNYNVNEKEAFDFESPDILKCQGCTINWKPGKDVILKTTKMRKKKHMGYFQTIIETVTNDSFFNFFNPPTVTKDGDIDENLEALTRMHNKVGLYIKDRVVPRALLYFTGSYRWIVGQSSDYVQMLPEVVKRRIRALKNLQHEAIVEQANFFNEVHELEVKCHQKNLPLYEQRRKIVNGIYEPSKAETQWNLDEENENLSREVKAKAKIAESEKNEEIFPEDVKGIPKFWLTVLKNAYIFKNIIQGCTINWKPRFPLNGIVKTTKKKKHMGCIQNITKTVTKDCFFDLFSEDGNIDENFEAWTTMDQKVGFYIKDRIVPRAVLYFTGKVLEEEEEESQLTQTDEESSDEESSDEESSDEESSDEELKFIEKNKTVEDLLKENNFQ